MGVYLHILYIKIKEIHSHTQHLLLHKLGKHTVADRTVLTLLRTEDGIVRVSMKKHELPNLVHRMCVCVLWKPKY